MMQQNSKYDPKIFPFGTIATLLMLVVGCFLAAVDVFTNKQGNSVIEVLTLVVFIVFGLVHYYSRLVVLKAQNRAIIAEENLRHTMLTGKALDSRLQLSQIIALRLAPDEQFPYLAQLSIEKKFSCSEIKRQFKSSRNGAKGSKMNDE